VLPWPWVEPATMGKSIRSKIKKKHRARKRMLGAEADKLQKALMAVRNGALDAAEAPADPELSKPVRFSFNPHAYPNKPREPIVPATARPEAEVPLRSMESKEGAMETEKTERQLKSWRSVLRQRVKKKEGRRKKRGWDEIPSVLYSRIDRTVPAAGGGQ
jgi:hypothetical protein